ncbi:MAG TPA: alcohol dehydrogenase catalytic domain-containing protein [Hyphomicrobiaceae bacterium]|nr:alcohol dehydrogenase catalytic domain-containing protein [Hyphomicrobiaceae bacterium]
MKIQGAVLYEQGLSRPYATSKPLRIETLDLEGPRAGEVLVKVKAAGLCHSDLSTIEGARTRPLPTLIGHEGAGVVAALGAGVSDLAVGDHVVFIFAPSCGACRQCVSGRPNLCTTFNAAKQKGDLATGGRRLSLNGTPVAHYAGLSCFADHAVVPRNSVQKIDKAVPMHDAAMFGCAVVTGVGAAVNTAGTKPGDVVAVVGLGGVGLSCLLGAIVAGAERIIAVDLSDDKLALARQLGATETFNARDPGVVEAIVKATDGGVDTAFEMAGSVKAMELAYKITVRGGQTISAGLPPVTGLFSLQHYGMVQDARVVKGSYMGGCVIARDMPRYIELYKRQKLPVDRLRSAFIRLDEVNEGFDRLADAQVVRQIIVFD